MDFNEWLSLLASRLTAKSNFVNYCLGTPPPPTILLNSQVKQPVLIKTCVSLIGTFPIIIMAMTLSEQPAGIYVMEMLGEFW